MCMQAVIIKPFIITVSSTIFYHINYLIGWVAIQYHWILGESVLYLGESIGQAKLLYKQDESNAQ